MHYSAVLGLGVLLSSPTWRGAIQMSAMNEWILLELRFVSLVACNFCHLTCFNFYCALTEDVTSYTIDFMHYWLHALLTSYSTNFMHYWLHTLLTSYSTNFMHCWLHALLTSYTIVFIHNWLHALLTSYTIDFMHCWFHTLCLQSIMELPRTAVPKLWSTDHWGSVKDMAGSARALWKF